MKKSILFFITITSLISRAQSKDILEFKYRYKPETKYTTISEQTNTLEISYSGSEEMMQRFKSAGMSNPTVKESQSKSETVLKAGKLNSTGTFPLVGEYITDAKKNKMTNCTFYAHCGSTENKFILDSLVSKDLDKRFKELLLETMKSTYSQTSYPDKKLKIGESFSHEYNISIPAGGFNLEMVITENYKLTSINNGFANFEVTQVNGMKTNMQMSEVNMNASGKGKGNVLYDISNNCFKKKQMDSDMIMTVKTDEMNMTTKTKTNISETIEVSAI